MHNELISVVAYRPYMLVDHMDYCSTRVLIHQLMVNSDDFADRRAYMTVAEGIPVIQVPVPYMAYFVAAVAVVASCIP